MSWRVVYITDQAKLDCKLDYLVVRKVDSIKRVHLSEISVLVIESTMVSLTTALLYKLTESKVKVIFCDAEHNPCSELVPVSGSYDTSMKVRQQIKFKKLTKQELWTVIVKKKIINQAQVLNLFNHVDESAMLHQYANDIKFYDSTNREGHAAKVYFNALFGKNFSRSDENAINACLNYGYGILASIINREIVALGYLTQLGIFHDNVYNKFNLTYDIIEPLRFFVDHNVCTNMPKEFGRKQKIDIINLFNQTVKYDNKNSVLLYAIKLYVRSIMDALAENDLSHVKFCNYEL